MTNLPLSAFNIRTYAILHSVKRNAILISAEQYGTYQLTKFPGGGLEFNEGPQECIIREFQEEFNLQITKKELTPFYFTQHCYPSFLDNGDQVILLYYKYDFDAKPIQQFNERETYQLNQEFQVGEYWMPIHTKNGQALSSPADQECYDFCLNELK